MCNASLAIQVLPAVAEGEEVLRIVDTVIAYLKSTGLNIFVGPFETTIEGDFERLMEIAAECQRLCIRAGAGSVSTYIKVVYSPVAGVWSIEQKTAQYHNV
ncbi:MAG: thiamine-binding protein [Spirochaetaceae bacterium]|nr:thiamine-binding protein [Spirochaetaceae bacterium]